MRTRVEFKVTWALMIVGSVGCGIDVRPVNWGNSNWSSGAEDDYEDDYEEPQPNGTRSEYPTYPTYPAYPEYSPPCGDAGSAGQTADELYQVAESSVHELITCGGVQLSVARNLLAMVILSNEEMIGPSAIQAIRGYGSLFGLDVNQPFTRQPDGTFEMPITAASDGWFRVRFFDGTGEAPLLVDPFDVSSYLVGAKGVKTNPEPFDLEDPNQRHVFTWTYEGVGPLGQLLNGGLPLPESFSIEISFADLLAASGSSAFGDRAAAIDRFGPFASVLRSLEMTSEVEFTDERYDGSVSYLASTPRSTVEALASGGLLGVNLERLEAVRDTTRLVGKAENLEVLAIGSLAGVIRYEVDDPTLDATVTSDFGNGRAYPFTTWGCE